MVHENATLPVWMAWLTLSAACLVGCGSDSQYQDPAYRPPANPPDVSAFKPAVAPSPVEVKLDRLVYRHDDFMQVELLDPEGRIEPSEVVIAIVSPDTKDVEVVSLARAADGRLRSDGKLHLSTSARASPQDGVLDAAAGEIVYAIYYTDPSRPSQASLPAQIIADFAFVEKAGAPVDSMVVPELALTDDEGSASIRPAGTLLVQGGLPVQVALEELIVHTRTGADLEAFLEKSGATLIDSAPDEESAYTAHLVRVDPSRAHPERLEQFRSLYGASEPLYASNTGALAILSLALEYQLEGYLVSVNPRLQVADAPKISSVEAANNSAFSNRNMELSGANNISGQCIPNDPARPCVKNVPAVWAFQALFDKDEQAINVAVLDMGFAITNDWRTPAVGDLVECDMTNGTHCGPGKAVGPPTVGNSFFGEKTWHGTGVVSTLGAKANNGYGTSGVAGQIAVPMLYKYDAAAYAFDIGTGIRRGVDDGASLVNISAGYPCKLLLAGPDYNICSAGGRTALCTVLTAGLAAAATVVCATAGLVPFIGPIICAAAWTGVSVAISACIAQVAFGELRGPIESGVRYAAVRGVPVVTIAGNNIDRESLPPIVRDLVDTSNRRTEDWQIVPAMIPETVVVGATDTELNNAQFYGDRVDVWAPTGINYMGPQSINDPGSTPELKQIGATSAAAPYVAGVIANMMAVNPALNPRTPGLTSAQKASIVGSIKEILLSDEASWSNAELVSFGFADQPVERRRLVNPLAAVQMAAQGIAPDLAALGYDTSLGFSELLQPDDTAATATPIPFNTPMTGSIVSIRAEDGTQTVEDRDFYSILLPASGRPYEVSVHLTYPSAFGGLLVDHDPIFWPNYTQPGLETIQEFRLLANPGLRTFSVRGGEGRDNVYKVEVSTPVPATPRVEILEPTEGIEVCADRSFFASAHAWFSNYPGREVPSSEIAWSAGGLPLGSGQLTAVALPVGTHELTATAYQDPNASDSVSIIARGCVGNPPIARIITPSGDLVFPNSLVWTGYDSVRHQYYGDVLLEALAADIEDGAIQENRIVWRTNRTAIQPSLLGTGSSVTVRLYSNYCEGITHRISLQVFDSEGNPSQVETRIIEFHVIC
jgi:hypothetical protein